MTSDEVMLCREVRREMARHPIDLSCIDISVLRGVVYLSGHVSPLSHVYNVSLKQEFELIDRNVRRDRRVRDIINQCRFIYHQREKDAHRSSGSAPR